MFEQMVQALEEFFPASEVLKEDFAHAEVSRILQSQSQRASHRLSFGAASLVGADNGGRPGGYILVIDGAALQHVTSFHGNESIYSNFIRRLLGTTSTRNSYSI